MTVQYIFLATIGWTESLGSALSSADAEGYSSSIFVPVLPEVPGHTCAEASVPRSKSNSHMKHQFGTGFCMGSSPQKGKTNFMDHCFRALLQLSGKHLEHST